MRTPDNVLHRWRTGTLVLCAATLLSLPMAASAQTYSDPIIGNPTPPPEEGGGSGGSGGGGSGGAGSGGTAPPSGSSQTGQLTDATGQTATITLDNKALEFESSRNRTGAGMSYDPGLDSAQGGGANGGFPYWEANGDWAVTKSAECVVDGYKSMKKVSGTKRQTLSCYVEWMNGGGKNYVNLAHCTAGANNDKPAETKTYWPSSCPHPTWQFSGWSGWKNTSGWYRTGSDKQADCGWVTDRINQKRTRSASCANGSYSECKTYNGAPYVTDTRTYTKSRYLGACPSYFVIRYHFTAIRGGGIDWHAQPKCIINCRNVNAGNAGGWSNASSWAITWKNINSYNNGSVFKVHKIHDYSNSKTRTYRYFDIRFANKYK